MEKKTKKKIIFLSVLLLPFGLLISFVTSDLRTSAVDLFTPYESSSELTLDGVADEAAWTSATSLLVETDGGKLPDTIVTLKAVYTSANIYLYASWEDDTFSATRGRYNVSGYVYDQSLAAGGSEDRIAFLWEIGEVAGFDTVGGMVICHSLTDSVSLGTGEIADMWHVKAARGGGFTSATASGITIDPTNFQLTAGTVSLQGFADDKYVDDTGRHGDDGDGPYSDNAVDGHAMYIEESPTDWIDAMILTTTEISAGETLLISEGGGALTSAVDAYVALNANVPRHILRTPTLSHGDIEVALRWVDGVYSLETKRALDTGNTDDVAFDPTVSGEYYFSLAIFDDSGQESDGTQEHSTYSGPIALTFTASGGDAAIPGFGILLILGSVFAIPFVIIKSIKKQKSME
ncbi:hypothetical protein LCGC14_2501290 [marine sediment metagenome]|uniref:Cytochrome c-552/DMSO reductase-like haem-binding domain-containing protein n=1 Tax=marine sediment metagenome TaxID=412755 RepID=A0A0F9B1S5_9ZZZZ